MRIKGFRMDERAILPTKRHEDAGFDIYTIEEEVIIDAHSQHLFATGLAIAPSKNYWLMVFDRGSTGSKGLHVHCGVVDTGYRGELFICIKNDNPYPVIFSKTKESGGTLREDAARFEDGILSLNQNESPLKCWIYNTNKAIAQIIPVKKPRVYSKEVSNKQWVKLCKTERGAGKLGSSKK